MLFTHQPGETNTYQISRQNFLNSVFLASYTKAGEGTGMYCVGFWVERQKVKCKSRKCWKPPQPFPDCLRFLNVYSTVSFHLPVGLVPLLVHLFVLLLHDLHQLYHRIFVSSMPMFTLLIFDIFDLPVCLLILRHRKKQKNLKCLQYEWQGWCQKSRDEFFHLAKIWIFPFGRLPFAGHFFLTSDSAESAERVECPE